MANKAVGDNIRMFRKARGLTQKELAERIGKNKNTMNNWELGLRDPGTDNIKLIAAALEIPPAELIGHNDEVRQDDSFEVICTDNALLPDVRPGDRLIARRSIEPQDGDIVVGVLCGNGETVVRVFVSAGGQKILLPINRDSPFTPETDFTVRGRVVQVVRKL